MGCLFCVGAYYPDFTVFFTAWCVLCSQARNTQQTTALQEKDAEINRLQREPRVRDRATVLQWSI